MKDPRRYKQRLEELSDYEKLEWVHCAIDEVLITYPSLDTAYPLEIALDLVWQLREPHLQSKEKQV